MTPDEKYSIPPATKTARYTQCTGSKAVTITVEYSDKDTAVVTREVLEHLLYTNSRPYVDASE